MTGESADRAGLEGPVYPLPTSPNTAILRLLARDDNGATGRYLAIVPGNVVLRTTGHCLDTKAGHETHGSCPVVRIRISP